ncbi:MAG: hypothetical protein E7394_01065 [Ruminococcaceae bacterium]|nr:hypothetical protein [Oscillospiraceae bacterium]
MDKVSVIHCADMHLGKSVSAFERTNNRIRMLEIEQSCMSVIESSANCNIALLCGDIFDSPNVSERLCRMILEKIASMPDVNFFYSCGNHDPYIGNTTDFLVCNCPDNLHIFGYEDIECVTLENLKTKVYGRSFAERYANETLVDNICDCDPAYINIMCMHGEISDKSIYNSLDMRVLEKEGFDYIALGHIHEFSGFAKLNNMTYAYPGCVEPTGFDECGEKGYIKGFIQKGEADLEFVSSCRRKYHNISVDISDIYDYSSVINEVNTIVNKSDDIWRINLCGENNIDYLLSIELIENNIEAFHVELHNNTQNTLNIEQEAENFSLLGLCAKETMRLMDEESDDDKIKVYKDAFSVLYGLLGRGGER